MEPTIVHQEGKVQLNIVSILQTGYPVEIILPDQNSLTYQPTAEMQIPSTLTLDLLKSLVPEFVNYLEVNEDRKLSTTIGYRRRLGQFVKWLDKTNCNPGEKITWQTYYGTLKQRKLSPYTRKGHYHILICPSTL